MRKAKLLASDWQTSRYGVSKYPLLLAGDRLIGYADGSIFALDIYTGKEVISELGPDQQVGLPYSGKCSEPIHGNGGVYFMDKGKGKNKDVLVALRLADGLPLPGWTSPKISNVTWMSGTTHPTDPYRGVIVVANSNSRGETSVSGYDMKDGARLWGPISMGSKSIGKIGLGTDNIYFIAGSELTAVNTKFGDVRWHVPLGMDATESPATFDTLNQEIAPQVVGEKAICVGSMLHAVEIEKGKHVWCAALGAQQSQWVQPVIDAKLNILIAASQGVPQPNGSVKGQVRCIELSTGRTNWTATIDGDPGVPAIAGNSVYVHSRQENLLHAFDLIDPTRRPRFIIDKVAFTIPAVIGNGTLFIPTENGEIHAKSFAEQNAAYFNGNARIDIVPDGDQFTFSTNCLTMEAWVHSTEGGDIVTGFPLQSKAGNECFRFNLSKNGELGFGILSPDQRDMDLARSQPTKANDGFWHHVAVAWENGKASLYLDGLALVTTSITMRSGTRLFVNDLPVQPDNLLRRDLIGNPRPRPLTLYGHNTLTIGAFRDGTANMPKHHFNGLLREVRIWDKALSVNTLKSRMTRVVGPLGDKAKANEALLLGNWHLSGNMKGKKTRITNDVYLHSFSGEPQELASRVTDLILDDSAFPFLLDQVVDSWPDIDHWSSRGEHPIENPAAIGTNGVLSFGTGTAIYGIEEESGTRCWTVPTAEGASKPIAYRDEFFVLTGRNDLIQIDAETGSFQTVHSFGEAIGKAEQRLSSPACDDTFLAAAGRNGKIWVWERAKPKSEARTFSTASFPGDLSLSGGVLSFITGEGPDHALFTVDLTLAAEQPVQIPVQSDVFFAHHHSVFYIDEDHALASRDRRGVVRRSPSLSPEVTAQVIGLAASMDDDLLVAVTKSGALYGLSYATLAQRWAAKFPAPPRGFKARATLHDPAKSPIIKNGIAYCSHANSVVAFDGMSGEYRGLFKAPHEVTTALTVNDDGTVYFGGAPETGADRLDGALHSVVFGRNPALRLGIDLHGALSASPNYLIVSDPKPKTALSFMNVENCCVEAWINTKQAGEIFSICPSSTQRFGLQLSVGGAGKVQFTTWQLGADGTWKAFKASTSADSTKAVDGQWHHIATSCQRKPGGEGYDVRIYLDGVAQTVVSDVSALAAPSAVVKGLHAYIGADVTQAAHAPGNYFRGLIGDLRIWDTYMTASEISERMHVKLRGTEPSLAAYWNFALGIHDESPSGHDAEFAILPVGSGGRHNDPPFWLAGLAFDQPAYPFLTTSAIITQIGEEGSSDTTDDLLNSIYELTLTAYAADGSVLPNHVLDLWYVKHPDETGLPETITLQSSTDSQPVVLHAVLPDHELLNRKAPDFDEKKLLKAKNSFTRSTNAKGRLVLTVVTKLPSHGPSLDLHAAFMPSNQRFHLNVLNENQALEIPNPPFLSAQSALIQDYHYSSGGIIDETRSREVYRTILTAQDNNGTPRPRERFEFWATETVEIEVANVKYTINAQNSQTFRADEMGSITIDVAAKELKMPDLSVWAGFMHRGERTTVSVDQDAQAKLSTVSGDAMSDKNRMTNWKKGGASKGALLKDDYHTHSDKISASIRHLSSAAQPAEHQTGMRASSHLLGSDVLLRAKQKAVLMHQNEPLVRGDTVRLVRTQRHIMRSAPVTPEAVLKSLADSQSDPSKEVVGFEIDFTMLHANAGSNSPGLSVNYLTRSDGAQYMMSAPGVGALSLTDSHWKVGWQGGELAADLSRNLGNIFDDAFDWVKDAAERVANEIARIAIIVADTVMVAVTYATEMVVEVVNTVGDALRYVGEFLYKLAIMIIDVIKFLMFLFDWGAIIETHNILRRLFENGASYATYQIGQLKDEIPKSLHSLVDTLMSALGVGASEFVRSIEPTAMKLRQASLAQDETQQAGAKEASGVPGTMIFSRAKNFTPSNIVQMIPDASNNAGMRMIVDFLMSVAESIPDLFSGDFEKAGNRLLTALRTLVEKMINAVVSIVEQAVQMLVEGLTSMIDGLMKDRLNIPFVSDLYQWIVGSPLTFLDLIALVMAIPVNMVYGVITGLSSGTLRHFNEDARDLPKLFEVPVKHAGGPMTESVVLGDEFDVVPWGKPSSLTVDIAYVVVRAIYSVATFGTDILFVSELAGARTPARPLAKIIKGITGISSSCILFLCCTPAYLRLVKKTFPARQFQYIQESQIAAFALGMLGDAITLCTGINGCRPSSMILDPTMRQNPAGQWEGAINKGGKSGAIDTMEGVILTCRSFALLFVSGWTIYFNLKDGPEYMPCSLMPAAAAYLMRDLMATAPRIISPAYTQWGQEKFKLNKSAYVGLAKVRAITNGGSIALHLAGAIYQDRM